MYVNKSGAEDVGQLQTWLKILHFLFIDLDLFE